ncbi:MAG: hypothetical protein OEV45_14070 [Desulfobacteraceae bacterium]|nr:hypothetical protein [Desulfobacteraceae bacterium]
MSEKKKDKETSTRVEGTQPFVPHVTPQRDAWYTAFFIENHMDYFAYPDNVATPDQVRFMVYTENEERYYPCSDRMFNAIMNRNQSDFLQSKYAEVLDRVLNLIHRLIDDPWERDYLDALIRIKFEHETRDEIMIPSRVEKRLIKIFLNRTQIEDPYFCEKGMRNLRAAAALSSTACRNALNKLETEELGNTHRTLTETREILRFIELKRLLALTVETSLWIDDNSVRLTESDYCRILNRPVTGDGAQALFDFLGIRGKESTEHPGLIPKKILWMGDESGEIMVDLVIIRLLARLGHKIILCFKDGPVYTKVDFEDAHSDETLNSQLEKGYFIRERSLGKNELVDILRSDYNIIVISDGTRENVNLLLASTTFSRLFKEVDGVISRGPDQKRRFFGSHFQFTQNIFNIAAGADGTVMVSFKSRHPAVIKYTYKDLEVKAKSIIEQMRAANQKGMTVMFYSGIIGSIPGRLQTAKKIMSVFVDHLRREYAMTFIINPSDYFEEGMDADDLMYMWEIVQRSGFIDIWRFQTYEDIVQAFRMIKSKVPPEWVGKDSTFSTGCTKEMKIALDVQKKHPEMQIAGPAKEKFMRRSEYGVGMLYDQRLADICQG